MSMVLTLRKGHDFFVGGKRLVISRIHSSINFTVKTPTGDVFNISDVTWVEVLPGVKLRAAVPKDQSVSFIRVSIDAPDLKILRGELHRNNLRSNLEKQFTQ